jgi:plasmid maintenance system antidote protein VapI
MSEDQKLRKWVGVGYAAKVAGLGALALIGGARANTPADTALARRDGGSRNGDNATVLHLDQKGLPHLSNQTNLEHNLSKVTPELLDHLGKFVENPEQFIQNAQQQLEQDIQKQAQRQEMRRLAEKAQENPKILESVKKLFEEIPGKEGRETDRRKLDKGTERLTPDKIDPEVWRNVRKMLTEKRRNLDDNSGTTIVLVHGFTGWESDESSNGVDCNGGYAKGEI